MLTPYGAERYRKVDMANSPSYKCLPYGPTRGLQSTNPFQIVQTPELIAILTEHIDHRMIYMDGRRHPEDILDYPEWMGHSIGRWEGDTLVVDTIGMREETWLDTSGFEHSAKLHIDGALPEDRSGRHPPDGDDRGSGVLREAVQLRAEPAQDGQGRPHDAGALRRQRKLAGRRHQGIQGPEHKNPPTLPK